ncbi:tetratricopeptide repeat protein [bacterium]|nr:tetratricopeptide repeat protein [candidate division CSSED10-310 bacterium]
MRNNVRDAAFLGMIALVLRLGHFFLIGNDPVADILVLDSWSYDRIARLIISGEMPNKVYFQAPFYPYFLAAFYKIFNGSIDSVRIAQIILDTISAVAVFRITRILFGCRSAWIAGVFMAVYPVSIFQSGLILKTTLNIFFAASMIWLIIEKPRFPDSIRMIMLGLISGWAAATQGSVLLQLPILPIWIIVDSGWRCLPTWIKRIALFGLGLSIGIGPFTLRNYLVSGRFVLLTSQGGANFYLGNSPYSDGTSKRPPRVRMTPEYEEEDFHREAEYAAGQSLTPEDAGRYWRDEALKWMRDHPGDALKLEARKFALFWNRVEIPDNYDFDFYRRYSWLIRYPRYPFWIIGSLGLAGMIFLTASWRKTWFLYAWSSSYCFIWVMFHIYSRYRLPMIIFLAPFAAEFISKVIDLTKTGRYTSLAGHYLLWIGIVLFQAIPLTAYSSAQPLFNLGSGLTRLGRLDEARTAYLEALDALPGYEPAMVNLGKLAWSQGNPAEAILWWEKAIDTNPKAVEAHSNLGSLLAMQGKMMEAKGHFLVATQEQPYYFLGWLHLAQTEESLQEYEKALEAYKKAIDLKPHDVQALYGRAKVLEKIGGGESALAAWRIYLDEADDMLEERIYIDEAKTRVELLSHEIPVAGVESMEGGLAHSDETSDQRGPAEHPSDRMQ